MKYSIKQMALLLGTTTYKLRYYQKLGIIKPIVDENTGYRYYSVLDTRRFNMACNYSNLGFSLQETLDILSSFDYDYINSNFTKKTEEIKKEIIYKELCLSYIDETKLELKYMSANINKVIIVHQEEYARLEFSKGEIINSDKKILEKRDELMKYSPLVKWVSRISKDSINDLQDIEYFYGLNIKTKDAKELGIDIEGFTIIPDGKYLYTVFKKNTRDDFDKQTLTVIQDYLKENNINNINDAYSTCIFSTTENEDYVNFHNILLKI
ncbi:MAG: MerR family transcriptional regulator [Erysipelotrichaceae bacterium]|nr:MerR family transcriptional regulator [Erysipelotrichaceae bacterium]